MLGVDQSDLDSIGMDEEVLSFGARMEVLEGVYRKRNSCCTVSGSPATRGGGGQNPEGRDDGVGRNKWSEKWTCRLKEIAHRVDQ